MANKANEKNKANEANEENKANEANEENKANEANEANEENRSVQILLDEKENKFTKETLNNNYGCECKYKYKLS